MPTFHSSYGVANHGWHVSSSTERVLPKPTSGEKSPTNGQPRWCAAAPAPSTHMQYNAIAGKPLEGRKTSVLSARATALPPYEASLMNQKTRASYLRRRGNRAADELEPNTDGHSRYPPGPSVNSCQGGVRKSGTTFQRAHQSRNPTRKTPLLAVKFQHLGHTPRLRKCQTSRRSHPTSAR